ncbi:MAG: type I restriction enzyme HsdR N-terminal domain-containing protein [Tannerellaceae bacterium]|nr:type I restriction enzyme HsdR N-terminal domain-containing protein [Tannerellaceae bacterium]
MQSLNLPRFSAKVIERNKKLFIFDNIRRKYVALTPEEWVRQHFVAYLMTEKGFPKELLANEISIKLNGTNKRCDTIAYNRFLSPLVIVEYKSPDTPITQAVFEQIVRYNMCLKVHYLIVSNGIHHYCCRINYNDRKYTFLAEIPDYDSLEKDLSV